MITEGMRHLVGVPSEPVIFKVEEGAIKRYAEAISDPNPLFNDPAYAKRSKYGKLICPPGFTGWPVNNLRVTTKVVKRLIELGAPPGVLDGGVEFDFLKPIGAGDTLIASWRIAEIVEKEGKAGRMLFSTLEMTFWNLDGDKVLNGRWTLILR